MITKLHNSDLRKAIKVGDTTSSEVHYTSNKVAIFADVSGDRNPVHLDQEFAQTTIFKKPIVHGIFVASQISALIADDLPGPGSIYLFQDLNFLAPVYHDDLITCRLVVTDVKEEKNIITLSTICFNQMGKNVIEGKAIIKLL